MEAPTSAGDTHQPVIPSFTAWGHKPGSPKTTPVKTKNGSHTLGLRWPVERTNSWFSNYGQLRRNTDRFIEHRLAEIDLAVELILTIKLTKWADRWSPHP
jgi:hypothetical protein